MTFKDDLTNKVKEIFDTTWSSRKGTVVPTSESVTLGNDAVELEATILYADLADSTSLVDTKKNWFAAEVYKTYLHCAAQIVRRNHGVITAYDGDRIMAVYIGEYKDHNAVRTAMEIRFAVSNIIMTQKDARYKNDQFKIKHTVGIDTSNLFVVKTGVRGANDLLWVGRSANHAAKLSSLQDGYTWISKDVYDALEDSHKLSNGNNMWVKCTWKAMDNREIYRSSYYWGFK